VPRCERWDSSCENTDYSYRVCLTPAACNLTLFPPASSLQPPASSLQPPASSLPSLQPPASSLQPPASSLQPPASSLQPPAKSVTPSKLIAFSLLTGRYLCGSPCHKRVFSLKFQGVFSENMHLGPSITLRKSAESSPPQGNRQEWCAVLMGERLDEQCAC